METISSGGLELMSTPSGFPVQETDRFKEPDRIRSVTWRLSRRMLLDKRWFLLQQNENPEKILGNGRNNLKEAGNEAKTLGANSRCKINTKPSEESFDPQTRWIINEGQKGVQRFYQVSQSWPRNNARVFKAVGIQESLLFRIRLVPSDWKRCQWGGFDLKNCCCWSEVWIRSVWAQQSILKPQKVQQYLVRHSRWFTVTSWTRWLPHDAAFTCKSLILFI